MGINYKKIPREKINLKVKKKDERWIEILEVMRGGGIKGSCRIGRPHFRG